MNSEYEPDLELKAELERLLMLPAPSGTWRDVQERARRKGWKPEGQKPPAAEVEEGPSDRKQASEPEDPFPEVFPPRRSWLRVVVYASIAVILMTAITIGSLEAVQHLGSGEPILVITDETSTTGETTQTAASEVITTPATVWEAGDGTWQPVTVAIDGAPVRDLVVDPSNPSVLYAATDQGLFKSTDSAGSWVRLFPGVALVIALDPASPSTLYAITEHWEELTGEDWVMLRSDNGGAGWWVLDDTIPGSVISAAGSGDDGPFDVLPQGFVFDTTSSPSTVYYYGPGLRSSGDRGQTWTDLITADHPGPGLAQVDAVALDPTHPGTIYAASDWDSALLMRSTDGGASWEELPPGLLGQPQSIPDSHPPSHVQLAVDPGDPSTLYQFAPGDHSLAKFTDHGESWTVVDGGAEEKRALAVQHAGPGASAESVDALLALTGGAPVAMPDWSPWPGSPRGWVAASTDNPPALYAFGGLGVYKSTDTGTTWNPANSGLGYASFGAIQFQTTRVTPIVVDPASASTLYALTDQGIGRSTDGGRTWDTVYPSFVEQLLVAPSASLVLYAATASDTRLLRSDDGGATWTVREDRFPHLAMVAADSPDTLYAYWVFVPYAFGGGYPADSTIYRSTDGGASWQPCDTGGGTALGSFVSAPSNPSILYAAGTLSPPGQVDLLEESTRLMTSRDGGETLSLQEAPAGIRAIAVDAKDPSDLYILCGDGGGWTGPLEGGTLHRSTDAGRTWQQIEFEHLGEVQWISADPRLPGVIYAASDGGTEAHIYRSLDGGVTWDHISGEWTLDDTGGDLRREWEWSFAADLVADEPSEIAFYALRHPPCRDGVAGPDVYQLYKWVPGAE